jgi:hypothetical protein
MDADKHTGRLELLTVNVLIYQALVLVTDSRWKFWESRSERLLKSQHLWSFREGGITGHDQSERTAVRQKLCQIGSEPEWYHFYLVTSVMYAPRFMPGPCTIISNPRKSCKENYAKVGDI